MGNELGRNCHPQCWWKKVCVIRCNFLFYCCFNIGKEPLIMIRVVTLRVAIRQTPYFTLEWYFYAIETKPFLYKQN